MPIVSRPKNHAQPRNNGSVNIAMSSIAQLVPLAVKQTMNALSVNGFPVVYYRRRTTGLRCTCSGGQPETQNPDGTAVGNTEPGVQVLTPEGHGTEEYINSMLQGSVFRIERYGARNEAVDGNGADNPQRTFPNSPLDRSKEKVLHSADLDDGFANIIDPVTADDLFDMGTEHNLQIATSTTGCAVCLGTGFVGGYDCMNGARMVIDTQRDWRGDITLDQARYPAAWTLFADPTTGAQAYVTVVLPVGVQAVDCVRVWNNRDLIRDVQLHVQTASEPDAWALITDDLGAYCDGFARVLRLTFKDTVPAFTHVELQFDMGLEPYLAEWSRINFDENLQVPENMQDPSLVLSPNIPVVGIYDIITEETYRRTWKLVSVNNFIDREKRVNAWDVTARMLQSYELANLLPHRESRITRLAQTAVQRPTDQPGTHEIDPGVAARATRTR